MSRLYRDAAGVPDNLPTCPRCGSLCGRLAQVCADCGERLHPTPSELDHARRHAHAPADAALELARRIATREPGA